VRDSYKSGVSNLSVNQLSTSASTGRASLENSRTGQQQFFSTQESLDEFLRKLGEELKIEMEKKDGI
jgi:hypothetical protein